SSHAVELQALKGLGTSLTESGAVADMEVVARTALAFAATLKEVAFILEPGAEFRVELASGTTGSLTLNALIRAIRTVRGKHPQLIGIVLGMAIALGSDLRSWTVEKAADYLNGPDAPATAQKMTKAERQALAEDVAKRVTEHVARQQTQQVFKEAERDPAIKGLGVTGKPGKRPEAIVPRAEFAARGGATLTAEIAPQRRATTEIVTVTLIRPVLKDAEQSWKIQIGSLPDFGATMKDHAFLTALAAGQIAIPLRVGVEMQIELETKEEFEGGLWEVKERSILRVITPTASLATVSLPLTKR
ncbi:MAG: hypothetical protein ACOYLS_15880, partial [Polymorphobacter sp.]